MTELKNNGPMKIVLIGASTRPLIAGCLAAGCVPVAFDFFADWDAQRLIRESGLAGASLTKIECYGDLLGRDLASLGDAAILAGGAELRPELVAAVGRQLPLLGAGEGALAAIADPIQWLRVLDEAGCRVPESRCDLPAGNAGDWLVKQRGCCGGGGVRVFAGEIEELVAGGVRGDCYYQKRIVGESFSAVLVSRCKVEGNEEGNKEGTFVLGCTRQWLASDVDDGVGSSGEGWRPFAYRGSVGPIVIAEAVKRQVVRIANVLAREFSLVGVWGLDFVLDGGGQVWPVDLNPRITASAELFESAVVSSSSGFCSVVDLHLSACGSAGGSDARAFAMLAGAWVVGQGMGMCEAKRIVFFDGPGVLEVDQAMFVLLSRLHLQDFFQGHQVGVSIADVPQVGDRIEVGRPLMTIRSRAKSEATAVALLEQLLVKVWACLQD